MPKFDKRLLGTWKSDRRKTFLHFKPGADYTPQRLRKLKSLFGKLTVRWTRAKFYSNYEGCLESGSYEIVASDAESVVVRFYDDILQQDRLRQIYFEGDYYWFALWGNLTEWFRRVE